jgi:hypothetical protein
VFPTQTVTASNERQLVQMRLHEAVLHPLFDADLRDLLARADRVGIVVEGVWRLQLGDMRAPGFGQWHYVPREEM